MTALPSSGAFTMVDPTWVEAVGPAAAILYARIVWRCQRDGEWQATREALMAETGLSAGVIKGALRVLREREWVTSRRASAQDATAVWSPILAGQPDMVNLTRSDGESDQMELVKFATSSLETGKTTTSSPDGGLFDPPAADPKPLRAVPSEDDLDAEFVRFWSLYPRREGKKAARAAYGRARRTASVQQIAAGLRSVLPDLTTRERQYVPHPATWLNQGRWDDEVPQAQPTGARIVPSPDEVYDPAYAATLPPPPRQDLYG